MNAKIIGNAIIAGALVLIVTGCITPGPKSASLPVDNVERVKAIGAEIAKEQQQISESRSFINESYLDLWTVEKSGPASSKDGMQQNAPVDARHEIIRLQGDITAAEKDITNRQRRISSLMQEKTQLEEQELKSCFPAETQVLTGDGRLKPINEIKAGDMVMTFDIGAQVDVPKRVLKTYKDANNHYYLINQSVKATAFERFLTPEGWKQALLLKKGDRIFTRLGLETIHSLVVKKEPLEVHNLQVADSHTFYVVGEGQGSYLVHNSDGGDSGRK